MAHEVEGFHAISVAVLHSTTLAASPVGNPPDTDMDGSRQSSKPINTRLCAQLFAVPKLHNIHRPEGPRMNAPRFAFRDHVTCLEP